MPGQEVEVVLRCEMDPDSLNVRRLLDRGIDPFLLVLKKCFPGYESRLVRVLHETSLAAVIWRS